MSVEVPPDSQPDLVKPLTTDSVSGDSAFPGQEAQVESLRAAVLEGFTGKVFCDKL